MLRFFRNKRRDAVIERLYAGIARAARRPFLFSELGVPDTLEGRFDLLLLHVHLVLRRLHRDGGHASEAGQELCDFFFTDMDRTLREMGVGDLSVPKRMKKLAAAYAGRSATYTAALDAAGDDALTEAVSRILYLEGGTIAPAAPRLAAEMRGLAAALDASPAMDIVEGRFPWPSDQPAAETSRSAA